MKRTVAILAMLLVSAIAPVTALAGTAEQQAYAGSHVAFDTQSNAVVDYRVDGEQTVESVRVQSQSEADSALGLDGSAGLDAAVDIAGAALSLDAETDASATLATESDASVEAHDNHHGSLVIAADDSAQYVALNVSGDAAQADEQRVVYETDGGATAMVVGEGNVSVTDTGDLTAALAEDSRLVVRSYTEARTDADESEERLLVSERIRGQRRYFLSNESDPALLAALDDAATEPILQTLARSGPASVSDLADALGRDPSTISHHVSRLEADGLVERERDGRSVQNSLAPAAERVLTQPESATGQQRPVATE